jgi:hypothetical protein
LKLQSNAANLSFQVYKNSTCGIVVSLTAEDIGYSECSDCTQVTNRIFLKISVLYFIFSESEKNYAIKAIERMAPSVHSKLQPDQKIIINITDVHLADTDWQAEGFYCAMMCWLAERYSITAPPVDINFNKKLNKYDFVFH